MKISLRDKQKAEALDRMRLMGLSEQYIEQFKQTGSVCIFAAPYGNHRMTTSRDLEMIKRFEAEHDAVVFMVLRASLIGCDMDSYLFVGKYDEEWELEHEDLKEGYALTYTVNWTYPDCSEMGSICFQKTDNGNFVRIG